MLYSFSIDKGGITMSEQPNHSKRKQTNPNKKIEYPPYYDVVIHNDNTTTFQFIHAILTVIFAKDEEETIAIGKKIDKDGHAIVGSYVKEIAITKQYFTNLNAENYNFPLSCTIEPSQKN